MYFTSNVMSDEDTADDNVAAEFAALMLPEVNKALFPESPAAAAAASADQVEGDETEVVEVVEEVDPADEAAEEPVAETAE
jgi:hypothetical protein